MTETMQKQKSGKGPGCFFGCLFMALLTALVVSLSVNGLLALGMSLKEISPSNMADYPVEDYPDLAQVWAHGEGDTTVALIPLVGVIMREESSSYFAASEDMVSATIRQIRAAQTDDTISAIMLDVDCPGGVVTPADEIYRALLDFKASDSNRLVIAFCRDTLASGAYLIASAADWIITEPTTMIGSISVIMQTLNWKSLSDKEGITDVTISSGDHKDLLNPFQEVQEEDRVIMQAMIDGLYDYFLDIVCDGRSLTREEVLPFADGRVFLPQVALDAKLIDEIGYWDDAMDRAAKMLGVESVKVIRYEQEMSLYSLLKSFRPGLSMKALTTPKTPRFMYLWRPTL